MEIFKGLTLILHFIGLAGLLGGFMAQLAAPVKQVTRTMMDGAWTMLASGLVLAGIDSATEEAVNHSKFGIKALILIVIVTLLLQGKKKESIEKGTYFAIGLLAITNISIAVLW